MGATQIYERSDHGRVTALQPYRTGRAVGVVAGRLRARHRMGCRHDAARRIVFFDVENSSRAEHVERMLAHLELTPRPEGTKVVAMGNWRVVGHETAEMLARCGAELVHSAPVPRVKDWTDLRIAVAAGIWLGDAVPGDVLEIVTDDQAFDAVGDVAAAHGVSYRRISHRRLVQTGRAPRPAMSRKRRRRRSPSRPSSSGNAPTPR